LDLDEEDVVASPEYMACLDAGDGEGALALMHPDLTYLLALPGTRVTGTSKEQYRAYVSGRAAPADRVHHIERFLSGDDFEVVYGFVSEGEGNIKGSFMSAGRIGDDGLILSYESYFDTAFSLLGSVSAGGAG
jgi:ketosteroid isomerase-like protein